MEALDIENDVLPSTEKLRHLLSHPLSVHWQFEGDAPARQAFLYPVSPRQNTAGEWIADLFEGAPCMALIEQENGRIAQLEMREGETYSITARTIEMVARALGNGAQHSWEEEFYLASGASLRVVETSVDLGIRSAIEFVSDKLLLCVSNNPDAIEELTEQLAAKVEEKRDGFFSCVANNVTQCTDPSRFNIALHNYLLNPDAVVRRNRQQAYALLPAYITKLLYDRERQEETRAIADIDRGQSPFAAFSKLFGVRKATLRAISRNGPPARLYFRSGIPKVLRALDSLPTKHLPQSEVEWEGFSNFVGVFWQVDAPINAHLRKKLTREAGAIGWERIPAHLHAKFNTQPTELYDFLRVLDRHFFMNLPLPAYRTAIQAFTERYSLNRLLKGTRQWHEAVNQLTAEYLEHAGPPMVESERWSWPFPSIIEHGDFRIHYLGNPESLAEEGVSMNHCVSTLEGRCRAGMARVFSLRTKDGNRCATFDLAFLRDGEGRLSIQLQQHKAYSNRDPFPLWMNVVDGFMTWLQLPTQKDAIQRIAEIGSRDIDFHDWVVPESVIDTGTVIALEALHRCRKAIGLDKLFQEFEHHGITGKRDNQTSLTISLLSLEPKTQLLLQWVSHFLPTYGGAIRWITEPADNAIVDSRSDFTLLVLGAEDRYNFEAVRIVDALTMVGQPVAVIAPSGIEQSIQHVITSKALLLSPWGSVEDMVGTIAETLLLPAVADGNICIDWADIGCLLYEHGTAKLLVAHADSLHECALKISEEIAEYRSSGQAIVGVLFVLPDDSNFIREVFGPTRLILRQDIPEDAVLLFAAPKSPMALAPNEIRAFVVLR